jgi:hypothetical protein
MDNKSFENEAKIKILYLRSSILTKNYIHEEVEKCKI